MKPRGVSFPFTPALHPDEKAHSVHEVELVPWDYTERHRYRLVTVERPDGIAVHYTDMGKASKWPYPPFLLVGAMELSVQEMIEDCEAQREDDFTQRVVGEALDASTLIVDILEQEDEKRSIRANRSNFGRYYKVERNAFTKSGLRDRLQKQGIYV